MQPTDELLYRLALQNVNGIGYSLAKYLISEFGEAKVLFSTKESILKKIKGIGKIKAKAILQFTNWKRLEQEMLYCEKNQIDIIPFDSNQYPSRLTNCDDAPAILFCKGNVQLNAERIVAVIGTRKNTDYGKKVCEQLIEEFAKNNITVVSGLAYGIDIIAHKNCLLHQLPTIAVLAHGLDKIYPATHTQVAREMLKNGGLITEYFTETNPDREHFPTRNRIVAGMCDATVIIETDITGGSMITAELTHSYNRDVFAYPGKTIDSQSSGCNYLIKTLKAQLITSGTDLLRSMNWDGENKPLVKQKKIFPNLNENEQRIVTILQERAKISIDELLQLSTLTTTQCATALLNLELQGVINALPGKMYGIND